MTDEPRYYEVPAIPGAPAAPAVVAPAAPPPSRRPTRWPYLAAGALAVLVAVAVTYVLTSRSSKTPTAPTVSTTFTVYGIMTLETLRYPSEINRLSTGGCTGTGGYSDLREGAQVIVTDSVGKTVGVTSLGSGSLVEDQLRMRCSFLFHLDVPGGLGFYGVEVSHRGRVQYLESQMREPLSLSIGS